MTRYSRCPQCKQLHSPGIPCPHCQRRRRRRDRLLAAAGAVLGIAILLALLILLTACSSQPTTANPTLHRQTLAEIRAQIIATPAHSPVSPTPWPTIDPAAIDPVYCIDGAFDGKPYYWCGGALAPD